MVDADFQNFVLLSKYVDLKFAICCNFLNTNIFYVKVNLKNSVGYFVDPSFVNNILKFGLNSLKIKSCTVAGVNPLFQKYFIIFKNIGSKIIFPRLP